MTPLTPDYLVRELTHARGLYLEDPEAATATAITCREIADEAGDHALAARARALEGQVALHCGDIRGALTLLLQAERASALASDLTAQVEVAALRAAADFFTGAYSEALSTAERCIKLADAVGDVKLRIYAWRTAFLVIGTFAPKDLDERLQELLGLTIEADSPWERAITHNDIACHLEEIGDASGARTQIELAFEYAGRASPNRFARAVAHSTYADIELRCANPEQALAHAEESIQLLSRFRQANPYVLGASVRAQVQALLELGRLEEAVSAGKQALQWLGDDQLPRTRSLIQAVLADALRQTGDLDAAFEALQRSAQLERAAAAEVSELLVSLERARLAESLARSESEELAEKNRELAAAHAQLETRTRQLEVLQEQLRDQAERDWLTGVHNRRFLARELATRPQQERLGNVFSVAIMDLDHFKSINDHHGHSAGDQVLIRAASVLRTVMRASDMVVRSGGEEFLLVMPFTDAPAAEACCERVRLAIREEQWESVVPGLTLTISIGVATAQESADFETIAKLADRYLYEAKAAGRDTVFTGSDRRVGVEPL